MRKKIKKYGPGGTAPPGGFIATLLDNLGAVPVNGGVTGNHMLSGTLDADSIAAASINQFANANIPPNLMGDYRRGSINAVMEGGTPGQFNFMNQFMANNNLPAASTPPSINTDPFQFMPQVGLQNQMAADDQALQLAGPINTAGPQVGMPVSYRQPPAPVTGTPAAGLPANQPFNFQMPSLPGVTAPQAMLSGPGGINLNAVSGLGIAPPENQSNLSVSGETSLARGLLDQFGTQAVGALEQHANVVNTQEFDNMAAAVNKTTRAANLLKKAAGKKGAEALAKFNATGVGSKLAEVAGSKFGTFLSSGAGAATSAGVGLLGKKIQQWDQKDGNYSKAGAMGGGALQGAAIGSALGPIGTVVGAGVGAAIGAAQKKKFDAQARYQDVVDGANEGAAEASQSLAKRAILNTFPIEGIKEQVYNLGGETEPEAIAGAMPTALELAAAQQMNRMVDPMTGNMMKENHPLAAEYIDNDLMNIGQRTWLNSQTEADPNLRPAWSAGAVSNLMQTAYPGFKNSTAHAGYMQDVLFGDNKANFTGGRTSLKTSFVPGTVLTQGRGSNSDMNYRQMKKTVEQYDPNKSTPMHGDVIIGSYVNDAGETMYQIQGGNMADTLYTKDLSAKEIRNKYPMALMPPQMKHGGHTNDPDYLAEGGEMIQHAPGDLPKTDNNGSVTPITKTIARINGDKHSAPSGGVGMEGKESARIYSDQLHVPAELVAQLSKL
jgi:hypothetical protein